MRVRMAKIFGAILMLAAIWYAATVFGGDAARDASTAEAGYSTASPAHGSDLGDDERSGQASPTAVTSRVRDRVNAAVAEGSQRHTSE